MPAPVYTPEAIARYQQIDTFRAAGMPIKDAAEKAGASFTSYYRWKKGKKRRPSKAAAAPKRLAAPKKAAYQRLEVATPAPTRGQMVMVMGTPEQIRTMLQGGLA